MLKRIPKTRHSHNQIKYNRCKSRNFFMLPIIQKLSLKFFCLNDMFDVNSHIDIMYKKQACFMLPIIQKSSPKFFCFKWNIMFGVNSHIDSMYKKQACFTRYPTKHFGTDLLIRLISSIGLVWRLPFRRLSVYRLQPEMFQPTQWWYLIFLVQPPSLMQTSLI